MLAELAGALRGLGKHAEAQRCCTAAVTSRPEYQRGWLELGRAQAAQGECLSVSFAMTTTTLANMLSASREVWCKTCLGRLVLSDMRWLVYVHGPHQPH